MSTHVSCVCSLIGAGNIELNVGRGRVLVANYKAIIIMHSPVYSHNHLNYICLNSYSTAFSQYYIENSMILFKVLHVNFHKF